MSTHVLGTPELLDLITNNLNTPDLFSVALVSKQISPYALTHLWRSLPTARPILKLTPGLLRTGREYKMVRKPHKDEWGPFQEYSSKIYEIRSIYESGMRDITPGLYAEMQRHHQGPLFPSLRALELPLHTVRRLEWARGDHLGISDAKVLFSSPLLMKVNIYLHNPSNRHADKDAKIIQGYLCQLAKSLPPSLKRLTIAGHITSEIMDPLLQFQRLEWLDINYDHVAYSFIGLLRIDRLQFLTTLLIHIPLHMSLFELPATKLTRLSRLAITGHLPSFEKICTMTPNITHLTLEGARWQPLPHASRDVLSWHTYFEGLQAICPSIRRLEIMHRHRIQTIEPALSVLDFISPLFSLNMETFCLDVQCTGSQPNCRLSDDDIHEIASAWPGLQRLELFKSWGGPASKNGSWPTGEAVFIAARMLPSLKHIQMYTQNGYCSLYSNFEVGARPFEF